MLDASREPSFCRTGFLRAVLAVSDVEASQAQAEGVTLLKAENKAGYLAFPTRTEAIPSPTRHG